jgi:hypothetical protein
MRNRWLNGNRGSVWKRDAFTVLVENGVEFYSDGFPGYGFNSIFATSGKRWTARSHNELSDGRLPPKGNFRFGLCPWLLVASYDVA